MKKLILTLLFLTGCQTDINMIPIMEVNSKDETYWYAWKKHHQPVIQKLSYDKQKETSK